MNLPIEVFSTAHQVVREDKGLFMVMKMSEGNDCFIFNVY
jgi:hypothetical protein